MWPLACRTSGTALSAGLRVATVGTIIARTSHERASRCNATQRAVPNLSVREGANDGVEPSPDC